MLTMIVPADEVKADILKDWGKVQDRVIDLLPLRAVARSLGRGAAEGVRKELDNFIDNKVSPMLWHINELARERTDHAYDQALHLVEELKKSLESIIAQSDNLTKELIKDLDHEIQGAFDRLDSVAENVICKAMPDGEVAVRVGPFGGVKEITIANPAETQCYAQFINSDEKPRVATFKRWEFYAGALCEYEEKYKRIRPNDPQSIRKVMRAYEKLAEMAQTAQCAAPTPGAKLDMSQKKILFQQRADFFRSLFHNGFPRIEKLQ